MNVKEALHQLHIVAEPLYGQHTSERMKENRHFKIILDELNEFAKAGSLSEVRINVHFNPEVVRDFSVMMNGNNILTMVLSLEVLPRVNAIGLEDHKHVIELIHKRKVRVGDMTEQGNFPVLFTETKSEIESTDYFKTCSLGGVGTIISREEKTPIRDIWEFFIRGTKPNSILL